MIRDGEATDFHIRLPYSFEPAPDLIAATFVSIVGRAFEQIHLDIPIGAEQHKQLERWTESRIVARPGEDLRRKRGRNTALNFSGGFDSMAARILMPDAELISLDFGGRFARERVFFEKFQPHIIETNLVDIGLNRYSWTFMSIGSLLMRDELDISTYSFGSIMASSAQTLVHSSINQRKTGVFAADYLGMQVANPVAGLSEIASMRIVALEHPHLLKDILESVALPREEKFLRKHQMLTAVAHDLRRDIAPPQDMPKRPKGMQWGYSAATDLSSLYTMAALGVGRVLPSYPDGIPDNFVEYARSHDMSFMNKINPHAYTGAPSELVASWYYRLINLGIQPFSKEDWTDMADVMRLFN